MRKYFFKDAAGTQVGPVKLDVLKTKNLTTETPIWYDPLPKWTTAGQVDEIKSFLFQETVTGKEEIKMPVAIVVKPAYNPKRLYYYKDAAGQQFGPIKLDVLKTKSLQPESPVWYDPLPKWTTAGEVDEIKSFVHGASTIKEEIKTPVAATVKPAYDPKRQYYYKDAAGQQFGPMKLDVLKTKSLKSESPVWYDPLPKWTTAGEVDEIKSELPRVEPVVTDEIKSVPVVIEMKEDPKLTIVETPVAKEIITENPIVTLPIAAVIEKPAEVFLAAAPVAENKIEEVPFIEEGVINKADEVVVPVADKRIEVPVVEETVIPKAAEGVVPGIEKKIDVEPLISEPVITKVVEVIVPVAETPVAKAPVTENEKTTVSISSTASVASSPSVSIAPVVSKQTQSLQPAKQISKKKSTAWVSWVLSLLVLGATGYYVYQDIEKNKNDNTEGFQPPVSSETATTTITTANPDATVPTETTVATADLPPVAEPATTTLTTTTTNAAKAEKNKKALQVKKADEEKKRQLEVQAELAKQQADDVRKKEMAAQAALAKELQFRNGWSKYITVGDLNYAPRGGDDGVNSFDIPVYNGTDAMIDRVVVKIDYYKKESKEKILHTETVIITNIPPKSGKSGVAPENKRARVAKATITAMTSKKLHLCYPSNSGNSADPYYCN